MIDFGNIKHQPGFCYEFFKNQAFWSYKNSIGYNPCSFYKGYIVTNVSPERAWCGKEHFEIIEKISAGKTIPGCNKCYNAEQSGLKSRRQSSKELYETYFNDSNIDTFETPVTLDYSVGNLCNLKCTICGPHNSSKWIDDYKKLHPEISIEQYKYQKNQYVVIDNLEYLKNIRLIHFHGGGEPLLGDAHVRLLQNVEKSKGLHDVRVCYNVNATICVTPEVLDLWSRCELVELYFSIDDIGERFQYQRTGANWNETVKTLNWYKQNMPNNHMFYFNCTWGYLNLYHLDELYFWHQDNFSTNRLGDPVNLIFQKCTGDFDINHLSNNAMIILKNKFRNIPELNSLLNMIKIDEKPHHNFWNKINQIDSIRGDNFKLLYPEWSKLL